MAHYLVVTKQFLNYVRGDVIAEATKISEILSTEHKKFVMKVALPTTSKG
jgi:predicted nucleic-acid-binding Zn-ribbon protein